MKRKRIIEVKGLIPKKKPLSCQTQAKQWFPELTDKDSTTQSLDLPPLEQLQMNIRVLTVDPTSLTHHSSYSLHT